MRIEGHLIYNRSALTLAGGRFQLGGASPPCPRRGGGGPVARRRGCPLRRRPSGRSR